MDQSFHAGQTQIQNPLEPLGKVRLSLSRFFLIALGTGILSWLLTVGLSAANVVSSIRGGASMLTLLGALFVGVLAAVFGWRSRHERRALFHPAGAPGGFSIPGDPYHGLVERRLVAFIVPEGRLLRFLQRRWGNSIFFTRPEENKVAERALGNVVEIALGLFLVVLLGFILFAEQNRVALAYSILLIAGGLGMLGYAMYLKLQVVRRLVVQTNPDCHSAERISTVHGGGDPMLLVADLDQRLMELRHNQIPNRITKEGWDGAARHVSETGGFRAHYFAETQPQHFFRANPPTAEFALTQARVFGMIGGVLVAFSIPGSGFVATLVQMVVGATMLAVCSSFLRDAKELLQRIRWTSIGLFISAEGSTGKAEIVAGRARNDSFESRNTVIRSDVKLQWYAGVMQSESDVVTGLRNLVAVRQSPESDRALYVVSAAVDAFRDKGVRIREVDFVDQSAANILRANVVAQRATMGFEELAPALGPAIQAPELIEGAAASNAAPTAKFCATCGARVSKSKAAFCSSCGAKL